MITLKQIRLNIRDIKNKITGKQQIIDQYNCLISDLAKISAETTNNPALKKYILSTLDEVTESAPVYSANTTYIDSYNPWHGTKAKTRAKINRLMLALTRVNTQKIR